MRSIVAITTTLKTKEKFVLIRGIERQIPVVRPPLGSLYRSDRVITAYWST